MIGRRADFRDVATVALIATAMAAAAPAVGAESNSREGEVIYREHCATCHGGGVARAPDLATLKQMSQERIVLALTLGAMKVQAQDLTVRQLDSVSAFLASESANQGGQAAVDVCPGPIRSLEDALQKPHWNGWGVDLSQTRFQPAAMAQLAPEDVPRLKLKWAFGFPDANRAYGQPTVMGGVLFAGSDNGKVYALDANTGCVHWAFNAGSGVRTAITVAAGLGGWTAYFGNQRGVAFAVDALTGEQRWQMRVDDHPAVVITGAPGLAGDVLYVPIASYEEVTGADPNYACCTFRGGIAALEAATGKLLWHGYTIPTQPAPVRINARGVQLWGPSGASIWSSPTVDPVGHMIYATTGDSYSDPAAETSDAFVAFQMENGELAWWRQTTAGDAYTVACNRPEATNCPQARGPDRDFGSSPILVDLKNGRRALIAGQKTGIVHAIDPDREGAILWQQRVGRGGLLGGVQWGSAADQEHVYVAVSDLGLSLAAEGTPGAQKGLFGGQSYRMNPASGGGLYALKLGTGEIVWHTPHPGCSDDPGCSPAQSAAVTAMPGVVFSGGLDGHLRAYAAADGRIVWDVDTRGDHPTVNKVKGRGGSLDGPGAVVVGGMLYVNSGYAMFGTTPGNLLLAYSIDGK